MIKYNVEKISTNLVLELQETLVQHWEEIAMYKDVIAFNPDYEAYFLMDLEDKLHIVVVRDEEKLVGYFISFIITHPHYKDHKFAQNDILFIHPKYRGTTVAYRMLKYVEKELKNIGCSVMLLHMKTTFPFEKLCEKLGMDKQEIIYSKYIGE